MATSGTVKNVCRACGKPLGESEKAFLVGPIKTDTIQYNNTIGIDRVGTTKRDLLHSECWEGIISTQGKKSERLIELGDKVHKALLVAAQYGGYDGSHHKMWVIDQMVRELTGCPLVKATAKGYKGVEYEFEELGESEAYREWVRNVEDGEDGPNSYSWDEGCPP